ncbi:MAG TPA: sigma-70 family RNA polymerase sigma factor [Pyrinomonadaceae bacterium]
MGVNTPSAAPDPHAEAEQRELRGTVLAAIRALPANERLVTTLFYVNGFTQTDIGEFLQVPLTTVIKRLHSARRRLKESAVVEMYRDDLRQRRPSRDESFADKVNARLRPFGGDDWTLISNIAPALKLDDPARDFYTPPPAEHGDARLPRSSRTFHSMTHGSTRRRAAIETKHALTRPSPPLLLPLFLS